MKAHPRDASRHPRKGARPQARQRRILGLRWMADLAIAGLRLNLNGDFSC